jgi:hypothetical protein
MSADSAADTVPNGTKNDRGTYQLVYQMALPETVTKWHRETQSPTGIMTGSDRTTSWDSRDNNLKMTTGLLWLDGAGTKNYREPSTERTNRDDYQSADRKEYRTTILEAFKSASQMLKEDEYIDLQAPFESHRLHERMSDIEDG